MRMHAIAKVLAISSALAFATANVPVDARSTTGFASFKVANEGTYPTDPYTCLVENNGAVVNNCGFTVNLIFELPVDDENTGDLFWDWNDFPITVQSYWGSTGSFTCGEAAYDGVGGEGLGNEVWSYATFFSGDPTTGFQIQLSAATNEPSGSAIQLICWNVPLGAGIANINWDGT